MAKFLEKPYDLDLLQENPTYHLTIIEPPQPERLGRGGVWGVDLVK